MNINFSDIKLFESAMNKISDLIVLMNEKNIFKKYPYFQISHSKISII